MRRKVCGREGGRDTSDTMRRKERERESERQRDRDRERETGKSCITHR